MKATKVIITFKHSNGTHVNFEGVIPKDKIDRFIDLSFLFNWKREMKMTYEKAQQLEKEIQKLRNN